MRVLVDPVYTATAHRCPVSRLVWSLIEQSIARRDDVFFYLLYPDEAHHVEHESAFLERHPDRVRLLPFPYLRGDPAEEMLRLPDELIQYVVVGNSPCWDYDVLLTARIPMAAQLKAHAGRSRLVLGLADRLVFAAEAVDPRLQEPSLDLAWAAGAQACDAVLVGPAYARQKAIDVLRAQLPPSRAMAVGNKVHAVFPEPLLPAGGAAPLEETFRLVITGGFEAASWLLKPKAMYEAVLGGRDLAFVISTEFLADAPPTVDCEYLTVEKHDRDGMRALLWESSALLDLSPDASFSAAVVDAIAIGRPAIVPVRPWTRFLGEGYPFKVDGPAEASAVLLAIMEDPAKALRRIAVWAEAYWDQFTRGPGNLDIATKFLALADLHRGLVLDGFVPGDDLIASTANEITASPLKEVDLGWVLRKAKIWTTDEHDWKDIPFAKRPDLYRFRLALLADGWRDTAWAGVMVRD